MSLQSFDEDDVGEEQRPRSEPRASEEPTDDVLSEDRFSKEVNTFATPIKAPLVKLRSPWLLSGRGASSQCR